MVSLLIPPRPPPLPSPASSSSPARISFLPSPRRRAAVASCCYPRTAPPHDGDAAAAELMVARAESGDFAAAQSIWSQLLLSSAAPRLLLAAAPRLLPAYARLGRSDEILLAVRELAARDAGAARVLYPLAVSSLGAAGELALMEDAVADMSSIHGLPVDSATGNAFLLHYAASGTLPQMEAAYNRLKKSRLSVSGAGIRAMATAYIRRRKFHRLNEFVADVGLRRRDAGVGNLLWNLNLLSFAANFKMKSLQRAFLEMVGAGFRPDVTTFNIRAAAFSKMCFFWDLHLTADHMRRDGVAPDLVTHGCFVDAYIERRLGRNLGFAFDRLAGGGGGEPAVETDGIVFEAFGKGGFHASSEVLMEATGGERRRWTYYKLLGVYLRKQHRKNQIFWNY